MSTSIRPQKSNFILKVQNPQWKSLGLWNRLYFQYNLQKQLTRFYVHERDDFVFVPSSADWSADWTADWRSNNCTTHGETSMMKMCMNFMFPQFYFARLLCLICTIPDAFHDKSIERNYLLHLSEIWMITFAPMEPDQFLYVQCTWPIAKKVTHFCLFYLLP